MRKKQWHIVVFTVILSALISACGPGELLGPTMTPTPTITMTPTLTLTPTITPTFTPTLTLTPNLAATYLPLLPKIPAGFEWKVFPDNKVAVLLPDGWFLKEETRAELNLDSVYITKENIDESGRFSTGQTVLVFKDLKNQDEAKRFSLKLLDQHKNLATTTAILKEWDYKTDAYTVHHLRISAQFPDETDVNRNKTIQYSVIPANSSVYLIIFECPSTVWEQTIKDYGILLDYVAVFKN